jgi:hypothetical protein
LGDVSRSTRRAPVESVTTRRQRYLCVKDGAAWKIVAVAWDNESATAKLPTSLEDDRSN